MRLWMNICRFSDEEAFQDVMENELQFVERCLRTNPKSYGSWHQRCFVMASMPKPDWKQELNLCNKYLELDERNCTCFHWIWQSSTCTHNWKHPVAWFLTSEIFLSVHCWDYRRFVVGHSNVPPEEELKFTTEKISSNFSNFSSWHYRSKLLPVLHPDEHHPVGISEDILLKGIGKCLMSMCYRTRVYKTETLESWSNCSVVVVNLFCPEYELVQNAFFTDPSDQSAWFYHRWLLGRGKHDNDSCERVNDVWNSVWDTERMLSSTNRSWFKEICELFVWHFSKSWLVLATVICFSGTNKSDCGAFQTRKGKVTYDSPQAGDISISVGSARPFCNLWPLLMENWCWAELNCQWEGRLSSWTADDSAVFSRESGPDGVVFYDEDDHTYMTPFGCPTRATLPQVIRCFANAHTVNALWPWSPFPSGTYPPLGWTHLWLPPTGLDPPHCLGWTPLSGPDVPPDPTDPPFQPHTRHDPITWWSARAFSCALLRQLLWNLLNNFRLELTARCTSELTILYCVTLGQHLPKTNTRKCG